MIRIWGWRRLALLLAGGASSGYKIWMVCRNSADTCRRMCRYVSACDPVRIGVYADTYRRIFWFVSAVVWLGCWIFLCFLLDLFALGVGGVLQWCWWGGGACVDFVGEGVGVAGCVWGCFGAWGEGVVQWLGGAGGCGCGVFLLCCWLGGGLGVGGFL